MDAYLHTIINCDNENENDSDRWYILEKPLYEISAENIKTRYSLLAGIIIAMIFH